MSEEKGRDRVELVATVLLSVATVATAWSAYQANRWNGEQAKATSRANAARIESTRASGVANRQVQIDVALFTQFIDAFAQQQTELADFYRTRLREEFTPAFEAWVAARAPLEPGRAADAVRAPAVRARGERGGRTAGGGGRRLRRGGAPEHPAELELRPRRRALRSLALLRGHEHEACDAATSRRVARDRLRALRRHGALDCDVSHQRVGLTPELRGVAGRGRRLSERGSPAGRADARRRALG
jgi:hypothetical protein